MKINEVDIGKMEYDELVRARTVIDKHIDELRAKAAERYSLALLGNARVPRKRKSSNGPDAPDEAAS